MEAWFRWLEATPLAARVREAAWLFPAIETVHIIGFVALAGAAFLFDLRLLGLSRSLRVTALARHALPWARRSLVLLVVPTGLLLFATQATELANSGVFRLKLALIAAAGINALVFHRRTMRTVDRWDYDARTPVAAKVAGGASLVLWTAVITCGRFLAYF
ncbi:MAG TPA: DUF6644 family protein [Thermoanaerobaculia bacterium]